jgi:hypothetical protein
MKPTIASAVARLIHELAAGRRDCRTEPEGRRRRQPWLRLGAGRVSAVVVSGACCTALVACEPSSEPLAALAATEVPVRTFVEGATIEVGHQLGKLRSSAEVQAFEITTHPITVADYLHCVERGVCAPPADTSGACEPPPDTERPPPDDSPDVEHRDDLSRTRRTVLTGPTFSSAPEAARLPVTCTMPAQADGYCAWIGGTVPTPEQWLLAARGPKVVRYPWGNDPIDCDRHPGAEACDPVPDPLPAWWIGGHPNGASPSGIEDALLSATELVRATEGSMAVGCLHGRGHCRVGSLIQPAAIDLFWQLEGGAGGRTEYVDGVRQPNESTAGMMAATYGFRCAWRVER